MNVYYDRDREPPEARLHPYTAAGPDQSGYVDFKACPELIRTVLEDIRPFGARPAVEKFYSFLEWINSPLSPLETNDCAMRPPAPNGDSNSDLALVVYGRVCLLYRNPAWNSSEAHARWLCGRLMTALKDTDPGLSAREGVVGFTSSPILQLAISKGAPRPDGSFEASADDPGIGREVMLTFWAYGNDEDHAFSNLDRVFTNIWSACEVVSKEIVTAHPAR